MKPYSATNHAIEILDHYITGEATPADLVSAIQDLLVETACIRASYYAMVNADNEANKE